MNYHPFSDWLRRRRHELQLSQDDVARLPGVQASQSVLSAWERGTSLPTENDPRLLGLARALESPIEEVTTALDTQRRADRDELVLTHETYLSVQQDYVSENLKSGVSIWLIGPESVPVRTSPRIRQAWRDNLARGVTYHVIWPLCLVKPGTLAALAGVLTELEVPTQEKGRRGRIVHHGVQLFQGVGADRLKTNEDEYDQIRDDVTAHPALAELHVYEPRRNLPEAIAQAEVSKSWLLSEFANLFLRFGAITVCIPSTVIRAPLASLHLASVRFSLSSQTGPAWLLFDDAFSRDLARFIKEFNAFSERPSPGDTTRKPVRAPP